jgi:hypothetical protein
LPANAFSGIEMSAQAPSELPVSAGTLLESTGSGLPLIVPFCGAQVVPPSAETSKYR